MPRRLTAAEESLQRTIADYLALCVPVPPAGPWCTAVNPIPAKSRAAAGVSKAMGLRAGTPDIVLCWKGRLIGIELKAGRGRLSPAQVETHDAITLAGGVVTTCRTLDDVVSFLATLGVPSRAHSAISGREAVLTTRNTVFAPCARRVNSAARLCRVRDSRPQCDCVQMIKVQE